MEVEKIKEIVDRFLIDEFEVDGDAISNEKNMKETLGLDSLDYIDMVVLIESNFGVKMGESDFKQATSFEDFYHLIQHKIEYKVSA